MFTYRPIFSDTELKKFARERARDAIIRATLAVVTLGPLAVVFGALGGAIVSVYQPLLLAG